MTTADLIVRLLRPEAPDKKFTQAEVDAINAIAASWELRSGVARPAHTTQLPLEPASDPPVTPATAVDGSDVCNVTAASIAQ